MAQVVQYLLLLFFIFDKKDVYCRTTSWNLDLLRSSQCRIVGGDPVKIEEVPYQVAVFWLWPTSNSKLFVCGGTILNARTILTAAHCIPNIFPFVVVRIGSADKDIGGHTYKAGDFRIHPQYHDKKYDYDVGVIKLTEDMKLDGVTARAVKLPASGVDIVDGTQLLVSGWGDTAFEGTSATTLLGVKVPVVSQTDCEKAYEAIKINVTPRMICAADNGKDSCRGDSGGPAVVKATGELVGVVSWGYGCATPGYPGVYAKVTDPDLRDFIDKNLEWSLE